MVTVERVRKANGRESLSCRFWSAKKVVWRARYAASSMLGLELSFLVAGLDFSFQAVTKDSSKGS